jgi:signal transduction histidine kinase
MSRILIAEDEQQLRMGIALSLKTSGYDIAETGNGVDALQAIIQMKSAGTPFDLLVCDIQMPRMTGEELLVKLKELRATLPTLVITGFGEKELLVRLLRAGCRDFVDKPFEPDALCRQVNAMLAESADISHEVKRREHLASIGEKVVQTAHDLNSIIDGALGYAESALDELEPGHPIRRRLEKLMATSNRAAEICRNLLSGHRAAEESFRIATEITSLAARAAAVLEDIAPENIIVTANAPDGPVWLSADGERLQQALLNLGFNAFAAMERNGQLTISVASERAARPGPESLEQACVVLSVRDTGKGLLPGEMGRIFKEGHEARAYGFGLGLGIVKKIIENEHHGWITVESEPGKGTLFTLYLPIE